MTPQPSLPAGHSSCLKSGAGSGVDVACSATRWPDDLPVAGLVLVTPPGFAEARRSRASALSAQATHKTLTDSEDSSLVAAFEACEWGNRPAQERLFGILGLPPRTWTRVSGSCRDATCGFLVVDR